MSNIIKQLEQEQMKQDVPSFRPGDTVEVKVWVVEGSKKRLQAFEGVVIAIRNRGLHSAFTVRKISNGEGVERVFQTHSPVVDSISVKRRGAVRKAKHHPLRESLPAPAATPYSASHYRRDTQATRLTQATYHFAAMSDNMPNPERGFPVLMLPTSPH